MSSPLRQFTVEEADRLVPFLEKHMSAIRRLKDRAEELAASWRSNRPQVGSLPSEAEEALLKSQVEFIAEEINGHLAEVQKCGAMPKDLDLGLVDLPALREGQSVCLCWKIGESRLTYWHKSDEGFRDRKPLKRLSDSRDAADR